MKKKLVLWGSNASDERLLIALELRPEESMVNVFTFPESAATEAFSQQMMKEWRNGKEVAFPETHARMERELQVSESMLPEELKVEREDILQRAQTEWQFVVLSSKLFESYRTELDALRDRIGSLDKFESSIWEELKAYWDKVQTQARERNLLRDHANQLRDITNELFAQMKELRAQLDEVFHQKSKENHDRFHAELAEVEARVKEGKRLQPLFEELKKLQRKFRDSKLTREHRSSVWKRLDAAFKEVKEKKYGPKASDGRSPLERLQRRYDGLLAAIEKMERSIERDRKDLNFQDRKISSSGGQLEAQLRQAKIKMIEERIRSKEEKLNDMMKTKAELEQRLEKLKAKEAERAEKERREAAKREAEKKIAREIEAAATAREQEEEAQPTKAAPEEKTKTKEEAPSVSDDDLSDIVETLNAIAAVGQHIDRAASELMEKQAAKEGKRSTVEVAEDQEKG